MVVFEVITWLVMVVAMHRIWNIGDENFDAFPNQKMLLLLVISYTFNFLGAIVVFASTVYFEVKCGNIPVNGENMQNRLIPQKLF